MADTLAKAEWRAAWPLPFVAGFGMAGSAAFAFSASVFLEPMTRELGWSRTQFSVGFAIQTLVSLALAFFVGRAVDRVGPRRVALIAIVPFTLSLSALGLTGDIWSWYLLCVTLAVGGVFVSTTVWIAAVTSRFEASRGLAIAIALAGVSLGSAIWPMLAAYFATRFGWRVAFPAIALCWALPLLPLAYRFFFDARDLPARQDRADGSPGKGAQVPPTGVRDALRSRTLISLAAAGGLFSCMVYGLMLHIVALLGARGLDLAAAARVMGMVGLSAVVGRLGMGLLLDRLPTRPVALVVFLLPAVAGALLLAGGDTYWMLLAAAVVVGVAQGAEIDVITFIAARQFAREIFGTVFSVMMAVVSISASMGPLLAGALFDRHGDYDLYLGLMMPVIGLAVVLIWFMPMREVAATPLREQLA